MTKDEQWLLKEKYGGEKISEFTADRHRLSIGEPVAYVIGWQPFLDLRINLDSKPLIPRTETEWWTEQLLKETSSTTHLKFLDLCAGSGAIGCAALARLPNAHVYFGEIDQAHKMTILKNIRENDLDESRASVHIGDLFDSFSNMQFDIIAANPPYIPTNRVLPSSVFDYEPSLALMAGKDGLDIIRRIVNELPKHLTITGTAWIECDSTTAGIVKGLVLAQNLHAKVRADQYGEPRVVVVSFH